MALPRLFGRRSLPSGHVILLLIAGKQAKALRRTSTMVERGCAASKKMRWDETCGITHNGTVDAILVLWPPENMEIVALDQGYLIIPISG